MVGEAALITVTWEISSDSGALQGTGGASLAGVCNQEKDSISCPDTASTETEDLAGSKMPSNINLLPPPEADQSANSGVTFTWEQRAAQARTPLPEKTSGRSTLVLPKATWAQLMVCTVRSTVRLGAGPLWARLANALYVPKASCRYFCPTSFRYSSIALVASVFSLKMRCSFSPQRSTSDIIRSVKKSWKAKPMVGHQAVIYASFSSSSLPFSRETSPSYDARGSRGAVVIPWGHAAPLPAQSSFSFSTFIQTREEIILWRVTTFAPQKPIHSQTAPP